MYKFLESKSADEILEACNDVYEYNYITGTIRPDSILSKWAEEKGCWGSDMSDELVEYMSNKFEKLIKLALLEKPYKFIAH